MMNNLVEDLVSAGIERQEAKKEISLLVKEIKEPLQIKEIVAERIKTRTPIQYLLGKAYFMDFEVKVDKNVLIPRPETEILVEETVKRCKKGVSTVIDIGTGSGIIAIALAKLIPDMKIIAVDINEEVINLAKENAKKNNVLQKISFNVCDMFADCIEKIFKENKIDLIISNPPYVSETAYGRIGVSANKEIMHEPKIALSGSKENNSGLIYYERIFDLCSRGFVHNTPIMLALEIDPPLVDSLKELLKKYNLTNFEIVKDYSKLDRCLFVYI